MFECHEKKKFPSQNRNPSKKIRNIYIYQRIFNHSRITSKIKHQIHIFLYWYEDAYKIYPNFQNEML